MNIHVLHCVKINAIIPFSTHCTNTYINSKNDFVSISKKVYGLSVAYHSIDKRRQSIASTYVYLNFSLAHQYDYRSYIYQSMIYGTRTHKHNAWISFMRCRKLLCSTGETRHTALFGLAPPVRSNVVLTDLCFRNRL